MNNETLTLSDVERSRSGFVNTPERTSREVDTRKRDDVNDDFDYDGFDYNNFDKRKFNLDAPPPRVDERWGKMSQRWVAHKANNGSMYRKAESLGYRIRNPNTVPASYRGYTEQWEMKDAIVVGGDMILMEVPETHLLKMMRSKHQNNNKLIMDIKQSHGNVTRVDGNEVQQLKDNTASRFFSETQVAKENSDSISFDD